MPSHSLQRQDGPEIRTVPVRAEVHDFALAMEEQLALNDHKGGWKHEDLAWLLRNARHELDELEDAIRQHKPVADVLAEAADAGNFTMMVADVYRLEQQDHHVDDPAPAAEPEPVRKDLLVRALTDIPPFVDQAGRTVLVRAGEIATVTPGIADILVRRGKAVLVEATA